MITAEEARKKSKQCVCEIAKADLIKIETYVNNAVAVGKREISLSFKQLTQAIEELKRLGYTVKAFDSQYQGYSLNISW